MIGGRSFVPAISRRTLAPPESRGFAAEWDPGTRKGVYTAQSRITSSAVRLERSTTFELP